MGDPVELFSQGSILSERDEQFYEGEMNRGLAVLKIGLTITFASLCAAGVNTLANNGRVDLPIELEGLSVLFGAGIATIGARAFNQAQEMRDRIKNGLFLATVAEEGPPAS